MRRAKGMTKEQKKELADLLEGFGVLPTPGELSINVSPEGIIGIIKVITYS